MELTQIQTFFNFYGWAGIVIAIITIFLVGTLKYFNLFAKVEKTNRKAIYQGLVIIFCCGLSAAYYGIFGIKFTIDFVYFFLGISGFTTILYAVYENFGIRYLFKLIGTFVVSKIANEQIKTIVQSGVDEISKDTEVAKMADTKPTDAATANNINQVI